MPKSMSKKARKARFTALAKRITRQYLGKPGISAERAAYIGRATAANIERMHRAERMGKRRRSKKGRHK